MIEIRNEIVPLNEEAKRSASLALTERGFAVLRGSAQRLHGRLWNRIVRVEAGGFIAPSRPVLVAVVDGSKDTAAVRAAIANPEGSDIAVYRISPPREGQWVFRLSRVACVCSIAFAVFGFSYGLGSLTLMNLGSSYFGTGSSPEARAREERVRALGWEGLKEIFGEKPSHSEKTKLMQKVMKGEKQ